MNTGEQLISRLSPLPSGVPFGLRSVGRVELAPRDRTPDRVIGFVQIVWTVAGRGHAVIDGMPHDLPPEHTAAFGPASTHCLVAGRAPWRYRWITLDGSAAALIVQGLGLDATPVPSGPCPHALFDELEKAVREIAPQGEFLATVPAYRLLVEAACARERHAQSRQTPRWTRWADSVRDLIAANLADPDIGVAQIAEQLGMDRTTLTYRFRKAAGLPPKEYMTALRLQRAMRLLRTTDAPVAQIAEACGFSCANYFIRAFAKRIGTTPHRYRRRAV